MSEQATKSNWVTPQELALELGINPSVVYGWIISPTSGLKVKELGQGHNQGKKRYLVDKTTRPPLRRRGRPC